MGQYQQWLHFRDLDQQLHAQMEKLQEELVHLQEQVRSLEQEEISPDNTLFVSLLHPPAAAIAPAESEAEPLMSGEQEHASISQALLGWGNLPNFDSREMPVQKAASSVPASTLGEGELLPTDMSAFVEEHTQTAPFRKLPWWARIPSEAGSLPDEHILIDQQSARTNRLVERWLERWGRGSQAPTSSEEDQQ